MSNDALQRLAAARARADWPAAAEICERELGDVDQAMGCWRSALDHDPSSLPAFDALERLCTMREDWAMLAAVLERRAEIVPHEELRAVLGRLVTVFRVHLGDRTSAAEVAARLADLGG